MTLEDRIRNCYTNHPDWGDRRVSAAIRGSTVAAVRAVRAGQPIPEPKPAPAEGEPGGAPATGGGLKAISLDAVVERYDVAAAIRRELAKIPAGALVMERDFAALIAGKDYNRFRRAVDNHLDEFRKNRVKLSLRDDPADGRYYWGEARTVAIAIQKRDEFGR